MGVVYRHFVPNGTKQRATLKLKRYKDPIIDDYFLFLTLEKVKPRLRVFIAERLE